MVATAEVKPTLVILEEPIAQKYAAVVLAIKTSMRARLEALLA